MSLLEGVLVVVTAGLFTALVCGIGTLPFFVVDEFSDAITVALWGLAAGIMLSASLFGFIFEGLADGTVLQVGSGLIAGALLVVGASRVIEGYEFEPGELSVADTRKLAIIIAVLTVHSFPEGVALGVAFADVGLEGDLVVAGLPIPTLAILITVAISIQNIPEGLAVAIPMHTYGTAKWKMFGAAVLTSIPQPIGAAIAFVFVRIAREFLPFGFGFAAGAMIFLVFRDLIPEALAHGVNLPNGGKRELAIGFTLGLVTMIPLLFVTV